VKRYAEMQWERKLLTAVIEDEISEGKFSSLILSSLLITLQKQSTPIITSWPTFEKHPLIWEKG
jgi:histidinol-phosphate/aromatic aminotransferase/cobyric acid decarboxylase-like protein